MKRVEVLMSTYNGEKYVERQIDSILAQENVDIHITVRDDGSKDNTCFVIKAMASKNPGKISLFEGENYGYRKSFLTLLSLAEEADYYAFSDQDDVWMPRKICIAIDYLAQESNAIKLYTSNLIIVDENLNYIGKTKFSKLFSSLKSDFSRHRFAGCTYVFSHCLKDLAERINTFNLAKDEYPDHDFFLSACAYSCGKVVLDENAYINHVRLSSSVTSGGNGILKRISVEYKTLFFKKNHKHFMACLLLDKYKKDISSESIPFLEAVKRYKKSLKDKYKLIFQPDFTCGIKICDIKRNLKILMSNY